MAEMRLFTWVFQWISYFASAGDQRAPICVQTSGGTSLFLCLCHCLTHFQLIISASNISGMFSHVPQYSFADSAKVNTLSD